MTRMFSFTKQENELMPQYRQRMTTAESTEDVKKFFTRAAGELLEAVSERKLDQDSEDIRLDPASVAGYSLSERIRKTEEFQAVWDNSDLRRILEHMASCAVNRYKHLDKHPEKTDAKIFPSHQQR